MWQRFSEGARKTIFYAQEEAGKIGENYVSTEHILLGLVREPDPLAADILGRMGVTADAVRNEILRMVAHGSGRSQQDMQLTPRAKRVIDIAYDESRQLNNSYIGTEHLLLGLVREGEGLAARVLAKLGVSIDAARWEVASMQGQAVGERPVAQPVVSTVPTSGEEPLRQAASSQPQGYGAWQRFTERARKVVFYAQEEAGRLGDNSVGTIHLLLGLVRENDNVATRVMAAAMIDVPAVRKAANDAAQHGSGRLGTDMQLTVGGKKMIDMAYEEARALNNNYIGTEHLLLGLYRDTLEQAGPLLRSTGVPIEKVRSAVLRLQEGAKDSQGAPSPQTSLLAGTIAEAQRVALLSGSTETTPSHLLLAVLRGQSGAVPRLADRLGIDIKPLAEKLGAGIDLSAAVDGDLPPLSAPSTAVLGHAAYSAKTYFGDARISTDHLLLALATAESSTSMLLQSAGFQGEAVVNEIRKMRDEEG